MIASTDSGSRPHDGARALRPADPDDGARPSGVLDIGGCEIGGPGFAVIAGPCTVETREQTLETARVVRDAGASMFRGGAYKPRTSPHAFQGLGAAGLRILEEAKRETGMPIVTELLDVRDIDDVLEVADMIQIGARNMQNYPLLTEVGRSGVPVLIKRGLASTIDDLLMAAEYVLKEGNEQVVLCERGIRTFETSYRFTLDLSSIPVLKELTSLPVIVDPSHAAGKREHVTALSMAAAAVGADGVIVEVHPRPEEAVCDPRQQLRAAEFADYLAQVHAVAIAAGRKIDTAGAGRQTPPPLRTVMVA